MGFIVAVDGPAGSGKGTITKIVADRMNLVSIDTGAMYRCVALEMINKNIEIEELDKIKEILTNLMTNAVKYTDVGTIELNIKSHNKKDTALIEISVSDTGIGISKESDAIAIIVSEETGKIIYINWKQGDLDEADVCHRICCCWNYLTILHL